MNTSRRLWQPPNGCWQAEPGRKRRRSRGRRDQAEAQKLYRRLKAAFLLNQITFQDGSLPVPKTRRVLSVHTRNG